MRDQYVGDISDVIKLALLRSLTGHNRRLGIAWYYAQGHDGRPDGKHMEWRSEQAWRRLDPTLFAELSENPERSIDALERADVWPKGTQFHREPMPSPVQRETWGARKRAALEGADIVFLDPDNGLGEDQTKHASLAEIRLLRKPGRAIVFISFPGRVPYDFQVQQLHDRLIMEADAEAVVTLRTSISVPRNQGSSLCVPSPRWFTVVDPDTELKAKLHEFADALGSIPRVRARVDSSP